MVERDILVETYASQLWSIALPLLSIQLLRDAEPRQVAPIWQGDCLALPLALSFPSSVLQKAGSD